MPKGHQSRRSKPCHQNTAPLWKMNTPEWYILARELLSDRSFAEQYFGHFLHKELSKGELLNEIV